MAAYRMTPARRAALKKAQRASARKRRGKGKGKLARANRKATSYKRTRNALIVAAAVGGAAALASPSAAAYTVGYRKLRAEGYGKGSHKAAAVGAARFTKQLYSPPKRVTSGARAYRVSRKVGRNRRRSVRSAAIFTFSR